MGVTCCEGIFNFGTFYLFRSGSEILEEGVDGRSNYCILGWFFVVFRGLIESLEKGEILACFSLDWFSFLWGFVEIELERMFVFIGLAVGFAEKQRGIHFEELIESNCFFLFFLFGLVDLELKNLFLLVDELLFGTDLIVLALVYNE